MTAEILLFWAMVFLYVASLGFQFAGFGLRKEAAGLWGMRVLAAALAVHTAAGIARWVSGGHAPVTGRYELNLTGSWIAVLLFLSFLRLGRVPRAVGMVVTPIVIMVLGYGILEWKAAGPMGPAFQSPWLVVHVVFAWLAFGGYVVSCGTGVFLLLKTGKVERPRLANLPAPEVLDDTGYRFIVLGFIAHAVMLVSGSIWAKKLWGRYWSWDALETWSLLSFILYALYLHARVFLGWRMRKSAWIAAAGLVVLSISFWGVEWFSPSALHPGP